MKGIIDILLPMPDNTNAVGKDVDGLIYLIHLFMLILFVGWLAYYIIALYKHRRVNTPKASYKGIKNKKISTALETVVVIAEVVILVGVALPGWALMASGNKFSEEEKKNAIEIQVNAQQFAWNFRYPTYKLEDGNNADNNGFARQSTDLVTAANPWGYDDQDPNGLDDFTVSGEMVVPVDTPIIVHCRSMDVIHSFSVKAMRVCQDCIPGVSIPTLFKPEKEGRYTITCAQLCGSSHYAMRGYLKVVSKEEWKKFLAENTPISEPALPSGNEDALEFE